MLCLLENHFIPKRILELKDDFPLHVSHMFGKCHKPWRQKNQVPPSIRLETDTNPRAGTSVDGLVSVQSSFAVCLETRWLSCCKF